MKTTVVRVIREYSVEVIEYTDVTVIQDDDAPGYPRPSDLAETLVKAQMATGADIDWHHVSEKTLSYPSQSFDTAVLNSDIPAAAQEPPPPAPAPAPLVAPDDEIVF